MKKTFALFTILAVVLASCGNNGKKSTGSGKLTVTAAGATFPMPFYNLAFKKYGEVSGTEFNYGGIGSGGGIRSLKDKVVDFGATDAFLTDNELSEFQSPVVHIPTCMGAVVIAYNLPGIENLKVTPEILEGIFLGKITRWNDKAIKSVNRESDLPDLGITVVYRSDGSGTTFIFSDYMTKVASEWREKVGRGKSLNWPVGIGAKGNPGVAGTISQTPGTIGYIGSEYAFAQKISYAQVKNSSGNFIQPDIRTVSAAARIQLPADTRVMVTDSSDPEAYPISGFTWIILYKEQSYNDRTLQQAQAVVKLLDWLTGPDGQGIAESVNYAALPQDVSQLSKGIIRSITFEGRPVFE